MTREQVVLITLIAYKVLLIAIGIVTSRRAKTGEEFFLGGRRLGPMVAAISSAASSSSAWTLLGVSGFAYSFGLSAIWLFPACVGGFALNWFVLAPKLRPLSAANGSLTATEFLAGKEERPLRKTISLFASLVILVSLAFYVASQYQGAGKTFAETFDLSKDSSILLGAAIIVIYTMLGGFWAVSFTDTLQGLIMAATAIVLPIAAVHHLGGVGAFWAAVQAVEIPGFQSVTRGWPFMAGLGFVAGILGIGIGYPGQPHVVNRFMALESDVALRRARTIAMIWAIVVYAGMITLGLAGRVLLESLHDHEVIFVAATNQLFPPMLAGIMIAGALSAMMSTADSQLLVAASSITHDLRLGGPTQQSLVLRSRIVILLLSAGAVALALWGSDRIFSRVLFAWTAVGSAFGPLLLVSMLAPVPPRSTLAAMVAGFSLSVFFYSFAESRGTALERVVPFAVASIIALHGALRAKLDSASSDQPKASDTNQAIKMT